MKTDGRTKPAVDPRLDRGRPAIVNRFIRGTTIALRFWLLNSVSMLFGLRKPFSCKAYPGTYRQLCLLAGHSYVGRPYWRL